MLIIGSAAIKYWVPDWREPKDYDIIASRGEAHSFMDANYDQIAKFIRTGSSLWIDKYMVTMKDKSKPIEFEAHGRYGYSSAVNLWQFYQSTGQRDNILSLPHLGRVAVPPLAVLVGIKRSHLMVPLRQWQKHMDDYHTLKPLVKPCWNATSWYQNRVKESIGKLKRSKKLTVSNEEFFGKSQNAVDRAYEHDDIHLAISHYARPIYELTKPDLKLAYCCPNRFKLLNFDEQIKMVQEEAYAIALERKYVPESKIKVITESDIRGYFLWAVQRICTTLTTGWFRDFAIENYPTIINTAYDYVGKFKAALHAGRIRKYGL